jgi:integrase
MATITRRGDAQWQVKVRRKGFPTQSRTFIYRDDADKWARAIERELDTVGFVDRKVADGQTLAEVLRKYQKDITPGKKSAEIESVKINVLLKDAALTGLKMTALTSFAVAAWRDRRLRTVSGATVNREMDVLSTVINHARREWRIHIENPIGLVKRPERSKGRDRRFTETELHYLLKALAETPRRDNGTFEKGARNPWLAPLLCLALETAMRRGELLKLAWEHVDWQRQTAHLPDTKNNDSRDVPLSTRAIAVMENLPGVERDNAGKAIKPTSGPVFNTSHLALRKGLGRAIERARDAYVADCRAKKQPHDVGFLVDVHFHDTRHEATSRLAEKLPNILELSAVTGHKDVRMLKRYYHPKAEDIAKKLG